MISEGSRDTENWSNDAENSALTSQGYITFWNLLKQNKFILNCNNISKITIFTVFLDFFQKW